MLAQTVLAMRTLGVGSVWKKFRPYTVADVPPEDARLPNAEEQEITGLSRVNSRIEEPISETIVTVGSIMVHKAP